MSRYRQDDLADETKRDIRDVRTWPGTNLGLFALAYAVLGAARIVADGIESSRR